MYKYSLSEDEDNLLTPPEGTLNVDGRVSPLTGEVLNLNKLANAGMVEATGDPALVAPEQAPAPVGQTVTSYQEEAAKAAPKMFSSHFTQDEWDAAKARQRAATDDVARLGETAESRLVSAAPDWYKAGKPPASHGGWADAANMLGGVLAAGPNQALKDPRRPMDLKAQDARKVAMAGGLSTLLSNLFTRGQTDYKAQQDAALKEAQMMRTIPGGKSASQIKREGADKTIEQMQRDAALDDVAKKRKYDQDRLDAELNPDDPQAIAWRAALEANNIPHEQVKDLGRKALQALAATYNINLSAGHTAGQKVADTANKRSEIILEADVKRNADIDKSIREAEGDRARAFIPGVKWVNNSPPPAHTVEEARQLYKDTAGFKDRLDRMRQIQPRIVEIARKYAHDHGFGDDVGKALAMMGPVTQWTDLFGPEAHELANEAAVLQTSIQNFIRSPSYSNLGVMQKWEDLKTKLMVPMAGSPTGFLRGDALWKSLSNDVDRMWKDGVRAYGGFLDGETPPAAPVGAKTPEQQRDATPTRPTPPIVEYDPRTRTQKVATSAGASEPVPTDTTGGLAPQAPVPKVPGATPAPAPTPTAPKLEAGQKMYKVTRKNGKVEEKPMDPKVAAALVQDHPEIIASVEEM